jgi:hypothetical protein
MHGFFIFVIPKFFARRVDQFFEYRLTLLEILSGDHSEPVFEHIEHISDLKGGFADVVRVVLRTVKTQ